MQFIKSHFPYLLVLLAIGLSSSGPQHFFALVIMLYYWRQNKWSVALATSLPLTILTTFISQKGIIPFPTPVFLIISIILSILHLLPFLLDRLLHQNFPLLLQLLFFPSIANLINLFLTKGPTGSMGYTANHLVDIDWLMQWTSIVGIFGIGFLMYSTASILVYFIQSAQKGALNRVLLISSLSFALFVVSFGLLRSSQAETYLANAPSVRIATITGEQTEFGEALYEAHLGKSIEISRDMDQSSPISQQLQLILLDFKDHADDRKYEKVWIEINRHFEYLLEESKKAVSLGAKIIVLSEAEIITTKDKEQFFIQQIQDFAAEHQVYYFLGIGALIPDVMFPENPIVENKIVVIDDKGTIRDVYFKNVPVEGADPSVPGDGKMHILETAYGKLSYAICYDTDFPDLMRQVGTLNTDILLVPTGDWKAITPYHTKSTNIRSIENGFAQVRAVSSGLSSAVNSYGHYLATDDFFEDFDHLMIADVPIKAKSTIYSKIGDTSTPLSLLILAFCILFSIKSVVRKAKQEKRSILESSILPQKNML